MPTKKKTSKPKKNVFAARFLKTEKERLQFMLKLTERAMGRFNDEFLMAQADRIRAQIKVCKN